MASAGSMAGSTSLTLAKGSTTGSGTESRKVAPMFKFTDGLGGFDDEGEMHWRSLELAQRIGNRREAEERRQRNEAAAQLAARRRDLVGQLKSEQSTHGRAGIKIADSVHGHNFAFTQTDQQFRAMQDVRYLSGDAERNVRRQRERVDKLDDLTRRLVKLKSRVRDGGYDSVGLYADKMVDNEIQERFRGETSSLIKRCEICGARILNGMLQRHQLVCTGATIDEDEDLQDIELPSGLSKEEQEARRKAAREKFNKKKLERDRANATKKKKHVVTMEPQPPRDLKLVDAGHNFLELGWKIPILDGGMTIYEYELSYSINHRKKVGKKYVDNIQEMPPMRTSRWMAPKAVATSGFTLMYLRGATQYCNFTLRCRNEIGWSPPSAPLDAAETKPPVAPTIPLFFEVAKVSATTILLKWGRPIDDGGAELNDFELSYIEIIPKDNLETQGGGEFKKGSVEKLEEKFYKFKLGEYREDYLMLDLRGDNDYKQIRLAAINSANLMSDHVEIPLVHTNPPSWRQQLTKEIQRVMAIDKEWIDTDFYLGYSQRLDKDDYLRRLTTDLQAAEEEEERLKARGELSQEEIEAEEEAKRVLEERRRRREAANKPAGEGDDEEQDPAVLDAYYAERIPHYMVRKRQFVSKIAATEQLLVDSEKTRAESLARRSMVSGMLGRLQNRIVEVRAEIGRVAAFKGTHINSAVVHGSDQRFSVYQLNKDLNAELEKCMSELARLKNEIIQNDQLRQDMIKLKARKSEELQVVQANYTKFMADAKRTRKMGKLFKERSMDEIMDSVWGNWMDLVYERKRVRSLMHRVWGDSQTRALAGAWHKWVHGEHMASSGPVGADVISRGGRLLNDTELGRENNIADVGKTLQEISETHTDLELLKRSKMQKQRLEANLNFPGTEYSRRIGDGELQLVNLIEAEGFLAIRDFDRAKQCIVLQITNLKQRQRALWDEKDQYHYRHHPKVDKRQMPAPPPAPAEGLKEDGSTWQGTAVAGEGSLVSSVSSVSVDGGSLASLPANGKPAVAATVKGGAGPSGENGALPHDPPAAPRPRRDEPPNLEVLRAEEGELIHSLSMCYRRLAHCHYGGGFWDRGILSSDRAVSLGTEVGVPSALAHAYLAMADGYLGKSYYDDAVRYYELAMLKFRETDDDVFAARAHRGLQVAFQELNSPEQAKIHLEKAEAIEQELGRRIQSATSTLDRLKDRLVSSSASCIDTIDLERVTANCLKLRRDRKAKMEQIDEIKEELYKHSKEVEKVEAIAKQISDQIEEAASTTEDEMKSSLITGVEAIYDIEELKIRLGERKEQQSLEVNEVHTAHRAIQTRIANCEEEVRVIDDDLSIEHGPLMSSVMKKKTLRTVALNSKNMAGNEVTGTATGGVEQVVASEGRTINVFDIHTGDLLMVFAGDEKGRHVGEAEGHLAIIQCLTFYDHRVYSGGMDDVVHVWDTLTRKRELCLEGHEASVSSIAVDESKIITGGVDAKIILWDPEDGEFLRILHGHKKAVNCIETGPTWIVSGGAEGEVRVWKIPEGAGVHDRFRGVRCNKRLRGHTAAVTAIAYGFLELVSGAADGMVYIWWLKTNQVMKKCQAHSGSIRQLQFDATRIVSAGTDGVVCVTDITTGEPVQRLRGHEAAVLAVAFDTEKVVSVSADNSMRLWEWGTQGEGPRDKYHIWQPGDTLPKVAERYGAKVPELIRWNAVKSSAMLYDGIKLVVQKGDPSKLTEAEEEELERKRRVEARNKKPKTVREAKIDEANIFRQGTEGLAAQQKVHILEPEEMQSLANYGYTGFGDKRSMSSRLVVGFDYDSVGEHLLDPDFVKVEARRLEAGQKKMAERAVLGTRIGAHVVKKAEDEYKVVEEIDEVTRLERELQWKRNDAQLSDDIFNFLLGAILREESGMMSVEAKHGTTHTWWTETMSSRISYGLGLNLERQRATAETKEGPRTVQQPTPDSGAVVKMPPIQRQGGRSGGGTSGVSIRRQAHVTEMRVRQASWKGLSTVDPASEYGKIDPMFSRRRVRDKATLRKARLEELRLREQTGIKRLVGLSEDVLKEQDAADEEEGGISREPQPGGDRDQEGATDEAARHGRKKKRRKKKRKKQLGDEGVGEEQKVALVEKEGSDQGRVAAEQEKAMRDAEHIQGQEGVVEAASQVTGTCSDASINGRSTGTPAPLASLATPEEAGRESRGGTKLPAVGGVDGSGV